MKNFIGSVALATVFIFSLSSFKGNVDTTKEASPITNVGCSHTATTQVNNYILTHNVLVNNAQYGEMWMLAYNLCNA